MSAAEPKRELLDRLAKQVNCEYLSDLRQVFSHTVVRAALLAAVREIQPREYPVSAWADAYQYLTGIPSAFASAREGKDALLLLLREGR